MDVGNHDIKQRRAERKMPVSPGGVVADYVPFYFAPRSPMMYAIARGNVETYRGGTNKLIYLVTTPAVVLNLACQVVLSDRNAVLDLAEFARLSATWPENDFIDWEIMQAKYWGDFPDGRERRMAECLVHGGVPWRAFRWIGVQSDEMKAEVMDRLSGGPEVLVRPEWYF